MAPSIDVPPGRGDRSRAVLARGVVQQGVEHGSVVLAGEDGKTYQLGLRWAHVVGHLVEMVGETQPGLLTTAQQGTPVRVRTLRTLDGDVPA